MATKQDSLERVALRIPPEVKAWYQEESIGLGLSMGQYMSYVLVTFQRNQETVNAVKNLSEMAKDSDIKGQNQEFLDFLKTPEYKQIISSLVDEQKKTDSNRQQRRKEK